MEETIVQKVVDTVFDFPLPSVPGSKCHIRIFREEGEQIIVIASHIPGSRGRSITNAIEEVATKVMRDYQEYFSLPDQEPIWVQHYPLGSLHLETEDRVHLVTFDRSATGILKSPCWTRVTEDHAEASFLHGLLNE